MLRATLGLIVCYAGLLVASQHKVRYEGHKVIRVTPENDGEFQYIVKFQKYLELQGVDIWQRSGKPKASLDFRLAPELDYVMDHLLIKSEVLINDVQLTDDYATRMNIGSGDKLGFDYSRYNSLSEINTWMKDIVSAYSSIASMFVIAESFEGRTLSGIKISTPKGSNKPALWFEGGIHAREWVSPATVIYMAAELIVQYGKFDNVTSVLDFFDIYIIPVVNVDGYAYTWSTDRLWRKTRSVRQGQKCVGADPNRNWDFHWCEAGASKDPCSDSYCGVAPFSENVVRGVADFIGNHSNMVGFIDFHSYSQMWMTPWGYTKDLPKDVKEQNDSSAATVGAIEAVFGTQYVYGTIANVIYIASGSSADWTYGAANVKYSAGVELRDQGKYGFLLPPDQIIPSGKETIKGLLAYMDYIKTHM